MPRRAFQSHLDPAIKKLIMTSLPRSEAASYISRLEHWQHSKGNEWLAARLKALWNMALLARSNSLEQIPGVCQASRIACDDKGWPKGIEGDLVRRFAMIQHPAKLRRLAVAFRAYTALRLDETSPAQLNKAETSITSPAPPSVSPSWVYGLTVVTPWVGPNDRKVRDRRDVRLDSLAKLSGTSSYPSLLKVPGKDRQQQPFLSMAASLLTRGWVPRSLVEHLGDFGLRRSAEYFQRGCEMPVCGKIGVIQEGGAKARVVAMPTAWIQFYCMPYHKHIMRVVRSLDRGEFLKDNHQYGMSCATKQIVGVGMALGALEQHRFCAAVDLSSATDRFPLGLQQRTCSLLGIPEFSEALMDLRGPWIALPKSGQTRWYYRVGQPMGLYGSFPLFHLTHFLLLNALSAHLGLRPDGSNFAVLGDDVLVFSPELREIYLKALEALGVPVSQHKCYSGDLVEFAGFLITRSGKTATAFRPYKFSRDPGRLPVLAVCHALGSVVSSWGPYWERAYGEYVATRGMRDLTLEPLISDPEDPIGTSGLPGSRWIGASLNKATYYPLATFTPLHEVERQHWLEGAMRHWEQERFTLLKEEELLVDIGRPGVTDPSNFDPQSYTTWDTARKRGDPFREFGKDPLVAELRRREGTVL